MEGEMDRGKGLNPREMKKRQKKAELVRQLENIRVWSLGGEDPLEEEMVTHFSILAGTVPWTEEPGGLQSTGSQKSQTQLSMCAHIPKI